MDSESEVGMLAVVPEGAAEEPVVVGGHALRAPSSRKVAHEHALPGGSRAS